MAVVTVAVSDRSAGCAHYQTKTPQSGLYRTHHHFIQHVRFWGQKVKGQGHSGIKSAGNSTLRTEAYGIVYVVAK